MPTPEATPEAVASGRSSSSLFARMAAMMFLQYGPLGMWFVTIYSHIQANTGDAGSGVFSPGFAGYSAMAAAIGSLLSPVLLGAVSDRYFATQHIVAACHTGCALAACGLYLSQSQTFFFLWLLLFFQCFVPTVTLTNKIALRHLRNRDREYPRVRAIGTVGWIASGVFVGFVWPTLTGVASDTFATTRTPVLLGAVCNILMAVYSLSLPHTPPEQQREPTGPAPDRARLLRNQPFLVFLVVSVLACIPSMAYTISGHPFLSDIHFSYAAALLTLGQASEVGCMWVMPWFLARMTLKRLFILGLCSWGLRYVCLAAAAAYGWAWPVYLAIVLHGPCYVFIYVAGQLYIDRLTRPENRGVAQGYHAFATTGLGHLLGALATGYALEVFAMPPGAEMTLRWPGFWIVPALLSISTAVLFKFGFRPPPTVEEEPLELHAEVIPPSPADALAEPHES